MRDRRGLSQGQLARSVGVTRPAVSKWENGETENLKLVNILKLCQFFRISADELLGGEIAAIDALATKQLHANEPPASYVSNQYGSCIPERLTTAYAKLNAEARKIVDAQMEIAIETARRIHGSLDDNEQTAA